MSALVVALISARATSAPPLTVTPTPLTAAAVVIASPAHRLASASAVIAALLLIQPVLARTVTLLVVPSPPSAAVFATLLSAVIRMSAPLASTGPVRFTFKPAMVASPPSASTSTRLTLSSPETSTLVPALNSEAASTVPPASIAIEVPAVTTLSRSTF